MHATTSRLNRSRSPRGRSDAESEGCRDDPTISVEVRLLSGKLLATVSLRLSSSVACLCEAVFATPSRLPTLVGRHVLMFGDRVLRETHTAKCLGLVDGAVVTLAVLPPLRVYTTSIDGTSRIFNHQTGDCISVLNGPHEGVREVSLSLDGTRAVTISGRQLATLFDTKSGEMLWAFGPPVREAHVSSDGRRVLVLPDQDVSSVTILDGFTGELVGSCLSHTDYVSSATLASNGATVLTASWDGTAKIFDTESGQCLRSFTTAHDSGGKAVGILSAMFSPDTTKVLLTLANGSAELLEQSSMTSISKFTGHTDSICSATMSYDSSMVLTASKDKTAKLFDAALGSCRTTFEGHRKPVCFAHFSPDLLTVVTASHDCCAKLFDAATGVCLSTFRGHDASVHTAVISPDGGRVLTTSKDMDAKLFEVPSGRCLKSFAGDGDFIYSAVWSPDGLQILTASFGGSATLCDGRSGDVVRVLSGHSDSVCFADFI